MRESIPAMSTPTVVTVKTVHLYWIRLASVGGVRAAASDPISRDEATGIR